MPNLARRQRDEAQRQYGLTTGHMVRGRRIQRGFDYEHPTLRGARIQVISSGPVFTDDSVFGVPGDGSEIDTDLDPDLTLSPYTHQGKHGNMGFGFRCRGNGGYSVAPRKNWGERIVFGAPQRETAPAVWATVPLTQRTVTGNIMAWQTPWGTYRIWLTGLSIRKEWMFTSAPPALRHPISTFGCVLRADGLLTADSDGETAQLPGWSWRDAAGQRGQIAPTVDGGLMLDLDWSAVTPPVTVEG